MHVGVPPCYTNMAAVKYYHHTTIRKGKVLWDLVLRWPNTVFSRALGNANQRSHKDYKNMPLIQRSFYLLNGRSIFAIFLRN